MCYKTQRARAARRATHKSRQYVREPERSSIKVQPPSSSLVQYTPNTPPQNEGILSFALTQSNINSMGNGPGQWPRMYVSDGSGQWPKI